jgi:hypothetical protein
MKRLKTSLVLGMLLFSLCTGFVRAQCPEQPNDNGICDTMYLEVYPPDTLFSGPGHLVRVPIYVTHDQTDPIDSIVSFLLPLYHTHTNPTKYCLISDDWNNVALSGPDLSRSVFRHLNGNVRNRFLDMEDPTGWFGYVDTESFDLSFAMLWFRFYDDRSPAWWEGSRVLYATITLMLEDTMTICIDSTDWPPGDHLSWARSDAVLYIPRHNLPYCFSVTYPEVGDLNADGLINAGDMVYLINYLYRNGPYPPALEVGDVNCDEYVNSADIVFLIGYLFRHGPEPSC